MARPARAGVHSLSEVELAYTLLLLVLMIHMYPLIGNGESIPVQDTQTEQVSQQASHVQQPLDDEDL